MSESGGLPIPEVLCAKCHNAKGTRAIFVGSGAYAVKKFYCGPCFALELSGRP